MSLAALVLVCLCIFAAAHWLYGKLLARLFGLDPAATTPAHAKRDGNDFVPAPRFYLLSQHFSAISAAGPIAGPILAAQMFGWQPALLWIVLGCVFVGAMHDLAALVGSVRHGAGSVTAILRRNLNDRSYAAFTAYVWLALVYVIVAFTDVTARAFVEPLRATEGIAEIPGAAIASSSTLYLGISLALGLVLRTLRPPLWLATLVFVPLTGVAIWAGQHLPIDLAAGPGAPKSVWWAWLILGYCGIASVLPVWLLLQPRGYLGGFFLYITLGGGLVGLLLMDPTIESTAFTGFRWDAAQPLVPFLFVTIACGACSGFHGLVCSGTTSKQIDREPDAHLVGYGGMLLEGTVAVLALSTVMVLASDSSLLQGGATPDKIFGVGIGRFLAELGVPLQFAVTFGMLAFATFVYDTLDVCTRLARYLFTEFTGWRTKTGGFVGTVMTLALPFWLTAQTATNARGAEVPVYMLVWPLFGSTNQLLAGLTLVGLTLWLANTGKPRLLQWLVAIPMAFMMTMTVSALVLQIAHAQDGVLRGFAVVLLALALWVTAEAAVALLRRRRAAPPPATAA